MDPTREHPAQQVLSRAPAFHGLKVTELRRILDAGSLVTAPPGVRLCAVGEPCRKLYILLEGCVEVCVRDGVPVARLGPGQTAGEAEYACRRPWTVSLRTAAAVRLLEVPCERLDALLAAEPDLAARLGRNLIRVLSERLSSAHERVGCGGGLEPQDGGTGPPGAPAPVSDREHVLAFYAHLQRLPGPDDLSAGDAVVAQLRREGYSDADIAHGAQWTARRIPSARRFDLVRLSIHEALEEKWDL